MRNIAALTLHGACVVAGLVFLSFATSAAGLQQDHELRVVATEDGLTISADRVPMRAILEAFGRETGTAIRSQPALSQRVSFDTHGDSPAGVLRRLLRHESYMYIHVPAPGVSELWIFADDPQTTATSWTLQDSDGDEEAALAVYHPDDDAATRLHAVTLLSTGDDSAALPILLTAMTDTDAAVREEAIFGLGALGGTGNISQLQTALLDPEPRIREAAIEALTDIGGDNGGAETAAALSGLLNDRDPAVRAEVVDALAAIGGEEARRYLRQATHDEDALIRETATEYLAEPASKAPASRF